MEDLITYFLKLLTIFFGSGVVTLFAYWLAKEVSIIPKLISESDKQMQSNLKVSVLNLEKISSHSGIYEISLPGHEPIKLFSSHKVMKKI